jgi:hypothetical protein
MYDLRSEQTPEDREDAMTRQRSGVASILPTAHVDLGSVRLLAPDQAPRHTRGTYGEMWQWIGDGESLISLIVAARPSGDDSAQGLRHRLLAEAHRIREPLVRLSDAGLARAESAYVPGASVSFVAHVDGLREGIPLHNVVMMATTLETNYLLHVAATDTPAGREIASRMSASLRLTE